MRIPFEISKRPQIESGEYKVETRDGRSVRIICWDKKNVNYPIAALVTKDDHEYFYDYTRKGELHVSEEGIYDLFIVTPEPEMSEFEKRLQEVLFEHATTNSSAEEKAHQYSAELLSFAKQQLLQSGELMTQEHHEKLMETLREECKKDLPRWRKCPENYHYAFVYNCAKREDSLLYYNGHTLMLIGLEKLPGFKENK